MLEILKNELLTILDDKQVSLVMFCQKDGRILWHRGRSISGDNVFSDHGFPSGLIRQAITNQQAVNETDQLIFFDGGSISESARKMMIRHILICPVDGVFLYIDSGSMMSFCDSEVDRIRFLAALLQKTFRQIIGLDSASSATSDMGTINDQVRHLLLRFAIEEDCVLLTGETGSGKTHLAEKIHFHSGRRGPFVVCDTTTLSQELLESELFGHRKGAFTGAVKDKRGLVDMAHKGTLFLDEIAEVPLSFQVRLLRFIETKKYRILGDPEEYEADVRLLAATNRDLRQMVAEKAFREDLYYRLNIFSIHLPPLRERIEEIERLVLEYNHFLKGKEPGEGFWQTLKNHRWPGNIRELKTVIKRVGVLCDSPISGEDLKRILADEIKSPLAYAEAGDTPSPRVSNNELMWQKFNKGEDFWQVIKAPFLERELSRNDVKSFLSEALARCKHKYINCLPLFNLSPDEYKSFMKFLIRNRLNEE